MYLSNLHDSSGLKFIKKSNCEVWLPCATLVTKKELKYGSQEKNYLFYECSPLLGFIMSKKQERLRSELLSEDKITNLLVFLT